MAAHLDMLPDTCYAVYNMAANLDMLPDTCYTLQTHSRLIVAEYPRTLDKLIEENKKYKTTMHNLRSSGANCYRLYPGGNNTGKYLEMINDCQKKIDFNRDIIDTLRDGKTWKKLW